MFAVLFPGGSDGKESACNAGNPGSISGLERCPGEGNGNPVLYYCLGNLTDRGGWWAAVHGVAKSWVRLNDGHFHFTFSSIKWLSMSGRTLDHSSEKLSWH